MLMTNKTNQFHIWKDEYDYLLESELIYHNIDINHIKQEEWDQILNGQPIGKYRKKDLVFSLLTSSYFTIDSYLKLIHILRQTDFQDNKSQIRQELQFQNPQEPYQSFQDLRQIQPKKKHLDNIQRDICRTFTDINFFKQQEQQKIIQELLISYSNFDPEIGYSQGMNFIMGSLVYLFAQQNEEIDFKQKEEIFQIFKYLMYDKQQRFLFLEGTPGLFQCIAKLQFKLKQQIPELYHHFKNVGVSDLTYQQNLDRLRNLLYASLFNIAFPKYALKFQYNIALHLYYQQDSIIFILKLEGQTILHKIIFAMLEAFQKQLMETQDFDSIINFLRKEMIQQFILKIHYYRKKNRLIHFFLDIKFIKQKTVIPQQKIEEKKKILGLF